MTRALLRTLATALLLATLVPVAAESPADDRHARVDELLTEEIPPGSPGAAVAVFHDGEIVFEKGYGLANVELDVPITPRSVFYLGSVGKQFTAMAIALLEQEGKLSLDDDVRRHVPELPDYGEPITIRHLVHHTSGVRDYLELMAMAGLPLGYFRADEEVVELLARQKQLNFPPGEQYLYSNSGYFLLGVIVHRASGKTLREYARAKIFGPLGMTSSHIHDDYTHLIENRASSYLTDEGELKNFITTFDRVGSGGVFSTVEDLFLWDQNFYHAKVGGQELIDRLHTRGVLDDGTELGYAFGLLVTEHRGLRLVEHTGGLGGYRTYLGRFPDERLSVVVLANVDRIDAGDLGLRIAEIYLGDRLSDEPEAPETSAPPPPPPAVEVTVEHLEPWTGTYFDPRDLLVRSIELRDGTLVYVRGPGNQTELAPLGDGRFRMRLPIPLEVEVVFRPGEMLVTVGDEEPTRFQRVAPAAYTAAELEAFAGEYHSEELDVNYPLAAVDGVLTITSPRAGDLPLEPRFKDFFLDAEGFVSLRFRRDGEGRVTGFALSSGRVRDIDFARAPDAAPAAGEAPPSTDVYLVSLTRGDDGAVTVGEPRNVTARPGYDNQPFFLDGGRLLYTAIDDGQADIWVYDLGDETRRRVTATAESEYSPTPIPGEDAISVVRVEADGRQRLWRFPLAGGEGELLLPDVEPVGYHAWSDGEHLALFVLGEPPTLQRARRGPGAGETLAENVGRSLHRIPRSRGISFVHKESEDVWTIKEVDLASGETAALARTRPGREDYAWSPSGELWMGDGARLYVRDPGRDDGWRLVADLSAHGISDVTRLAVHPDGDLLAFVAAEEGR